MLSTLAIAAAIVGLALLCGAWLAVVGVVVAVLGARYARSERARCRRAARFERAQRRRRRELRELRIEEAGINHRALGDLVEIVESVTREAPREAERYKLDELLDRYADLLVTRETYERQLSSPQPAISVRTRPLQRLVRTHTLEWRETCARRTAVCKRQLSEIADLIRLYAGRARTPEIDHLLANDVVGRQLA